MRSRGGKVTGIKHLQVRRGGETIDQCLDFQERLLPDKVIYNVYI